MNGPQNGVPVPTPRHNGSHPTYSTLVRERMDTWNNAHLNATPEQAAQKLREWQHQLETLINNSTEHINNIVPPIISPL